MFAHHIRWIGGKNGSVKTIVSKYIISGIPTFSKCKNNERIFHKWKGLCTLINSDVNYIDDPMYTSASFKNLQIGYRIRSRKVLVLWKSLLK